MFRSALLALIIASALGCGGDGTGLDGGSVDGGSVDGGSVDGGSLDGGTCTEPMPTGCYVFEFGSCSATVARCVGTTWSCTTPADYAAMGIACETR